MATETVKTTPNPPTELETRSLNLDVGQKEWFLGLLKQAAEYLLPAMQSGMSAADFADSIYRSAGLYSDQALALARGEPWPPAQAPAQPVGQQIQASGGNARTQAVQALYANRNLPPPSAADLAYWSAPEQGTLSDIEANIARAAPGITPEAQAAARAAGTDPRGGGPMNVYSDKMFEGDSLTASGRQALSFMGYGTPTGPQGGGQGVGLAQQTAGGGGGQGVGLAPVQSFQSAPFDPRAGYDQISNIEESAITAGQKNIDRFAMDALRTMREELAPQLGMRSRDTPIIDRGGRLMEDVTRQKADLAEGIYSQGAQLRLDYPLKQYQTLSDVGVNEGRLNLDTQNLAETARQFNSDLNLRNRTLLSEVAQRGAENRLASADALMNRYSFDRNMGLGLLQVARPPDITFPSTGSTEVGKSSSTSAKINNAGKLVSAAGSIIGISSRELKNILEDVLPETALDGVVKTPVSKWVYKGENVEHIGPMAEDFQKAFGVGDGKTIHLLDAIGVLFASVQALAAKQKEIANAT